MQQPAKKKLKGGVLATVGYVLSPLSFWNDLYVNIPLAYVMAYPIALINQGWFMPAMIVAYWITNVIGFTLIHAGVVEVVAGQEHRRSKRSLLADIGVSIVYTALIAALIHFDILRLPTEYFSGRT